MKGALVWSNGPQKKQIVAKRVEVALMGFEKKCRGREDSFFVWIVRVYRLSTLIDRPVITYFVSGTDGSL